MAKRNFSTTNRDASVDSSKLKKMQLRKTARVSISVNVKCCVLFFCNIMQMRAAVIVSYFKIVLQSKQSNMTNTVAVLPTVGCCKSKSKVRLYYSAFQSLA